MRVKGTISILAKFKLGEQVISANKKSGDTGIVTSYKIRGTDENMHLLYSVTWSNKEESVHEVYELA